jgi:hypothetical protein
VQATTTSNTTMVRNVPNNQFHNRDWGDFVNALPVFADTINTVRFGGNRVDEAIAQPPQPNPVNWWLIGGLAAVGVTGVVLLVR